MRPAGTAAHTTKAMHASTHVGDFAIGGYSYERAMGVCETEGEFHPPRLKPTHSTGSTSRYRSCPQDRWIRPGSSAVCPAYSAHRHGSNLGKLPLIGEPLQVARIVAA